MRHLRDEATSLAGGWFPVVLLGLNVAKKKKRKNKAAPHYGAGAQAALFCFGIVFGLVLFFSCVSFNYSDWPSPFVYPNNSPPGNWCGSVGAFFAYHLLYHLGPGTFLVLIYFISLLVAKLAKREIDQPILRTIGLVLLTVAISASFYGLWPHRLYAFPIGSGGVLGVATYSFLQTSFARLGSFILLSAIWVVGLMLMADTLLLFIPIWAGKCFLRAMGIVRPAWSLARERSDALGEIWHKLNARQRAGQALARRPAALEPGVSESVPDAGEEDFDDEKGIEELVEDELEDEGQEDQGPAEKQEEPQSTFERLKALAVHRNEAKGARKSAYVQPTYDDYTLPPLALLSEPEYGYAEEQERVVKSKAAALEQFMAEFSINAEVVAAETGPVITLFELQLAAGIKVSRITSLSNDIARALSAGAVRVVAPLPGKHTIGIEVPNSHKEKVRVKNLIELAGSGPTEMNIPLFLGKDSAGEALVCDLAKMPHLLIAGTTGSGKSICINSIIVSILLTKRPDEVKLVLVDPKMVEMTAFNTIPHLMCPIVTETDMAVQILEWATVKMDERYAVLAEARVKNIADFNKLGAEEIINRFKPTTSDEEAKIPKKLPYIVIIIDELADLMMTAPKEIESYIVRLAQKSRAVGIHIVLATQRPQATVVTGLIKSNMPCRIGFRVAARMDSRIILDQNGAEMLLGEGDMLFLKPGTSDLIRAQGTFLDDAEIRRIVNHLKEIAEPQFHPELTQLKAIDTSEIKKDDLFDEAARIVLECKRGSVSLLQRRLSIGYARSSRIIEMMAASGILGEYKGSQAREVLMTLKEYEAVCRQMQADGEAGFADLADQADPTPTPAIPVETVPEQAYVSEGQKEYMALESDGNLEGDDDEDEVVKVVAKADEAAEEGETADADDEYEYEYEYKDVEEEKA
ncbi:MAG: DNA translocase FtsK [Planctomycetes bacterium]|nr:DNA translocase FtsK [Planctomycetota bacterium]